MQDKICKVCCREVGNQYSQMMEGNLYVVVDEKWQLATILNKDDRLCDDCQGSVTYYRRIK